MESTFELTDGHNLIEQNVNINHFYILKLF